MLFKVETLNFDLNELIRKLKGGSSYLARKNFKYLNKYTSLWTTSHFLSTVGNVSNETIKNYINSQGLEEKEIVQRTFKFKVLKPTKCKLGKLKTYYEECFKNEKVICPSSIFQDFNFHKVQRKEGELTLYIRQQNSRIEKQNTKLAKYWLKVPGSRNRNSEPFWLGLQGRVIPDEWNLKDSILQEKNGILYLNLVVEKSNNICRVDSKKILSIDLGFNHPIASVMLEDGNMIEHKFYGKEIKNLLYRRDVRLAQLQHSGIENPNVSRYTEGIKHYCHKYVNEILEYALLNNASICVGKLEVGRKLRKGKSSKTMRKKGKVPFFKIMTILQYKARMFSIPLVFVEEYYTSQRCSKCGNVDKNSRNGERYKCVSCGYQQQADLNGAMNIANFQLNQLRSSHPLEGSNLIKYEKIISDASPRL